MESSTPRLPLYVEFFVPGRCAGAGSKTQGKTKSGRTFLRPASKFTAPWMAIVRTFAMQAMRAVEPLDRQAVLLWTEFYTQRPQSHFGTGRNADKLKASAPGRWCCIGGSLDLTKRVRALEDALKGIVWRDDRQVAAQNNSSVWCEPGTDEIPGARVKVFVLEN